MAMVFSRDALFIHVHKAGGTSVTHYLLEALPRPVYYVSRARHETGDNEGLIHIHGHPHQRLAEAREFIGGYGFDIADVPLILAVVRNPYDIFVSHYAWQRVRTTSHDSVDPSEVAAPSPRPPRPELVAVVEALRPGKVARIEPSAGDPLHALRDDLHRAAIETGRRIESWNADGVLFAGLTDRKVKIHRNRQLAQNLDFRGFAIEANANKRRTFLAGLYDFYHLDGEMPPNLRIVRFERMAEEVPAALAEIGIRPEAEFPWLNRSNRGAYADYYDRETEAVVYEQARWLFDQGYYERLDVKDAAPRAGG